MPTTPHHTALEEETDDAPAWPVYAEGALEAMRSVPTISYAARAVGINRRTLQRLIERDERFAVALHDARQQALDSLEETMVLRARTGQPTKKTVTKTYRDPKTGADVTETTVTDDVHISDNHAMFYLKRWRPEYRESYRIEQTGPGGGPIKIEGNLDAAVERFRAEVVRLAATDGEDEPDQAGSG